MRDPFFVEPTGRAQPFNVVGEKITVLAPAERTGGYEIFHQAGAAGSGPPPHSHAWDESFYVVAGEVEIGTGQESRLAGPGAFVHVPAGVMHWFRFGPEGGEMVSITSRAGAAQLFADLDREMPGPLDLDKLAAVAARNGLTVALPEPNI
jgi:quercetin dioxygenase-like cupin family protein